MMLDWSWRSLTTTHRDCLLICVLEILLFTYLLTYLLKYINTNHFLYAVRGNIYIIIIIIYSFIEKLSNATQAKCKCKK